MSAAAAFPGYTAVASGNGLKKQGSILFCPNDFFYDHKTGCVCRIVEYQTQQGKHPDLGSWAYFPGLT